MSDQKRVEQQQQQRAAALTASAAAVRPVTVPGPDLATYRRRRYEAAQRKLHARYARGLSIPR